MEQRGFFMLKGRIILLLVLVCVFLALYLLTVLKSAHNSDIESRAGELVKVSTTPTLDYQFDNMSAGVLQHVDRKYTYDIVPKEINNGLLFRSVHEAPKGTVVKFELLSPARVFFFFCRNQDGGYSDIFESLPKWKKSNRFPQYDIYQGSHGLVMSMFYLEADVGLYTLPATTKDNACFNIVFKKHLP